MVIKVYVSNISGNLEIKKHQDLVMQILQSQKVDVQQVDISTPENENEKLFMRENVPKDGNKYPLPPQIFNDEEYCGDYDALDYANECNEVLVFLKLAEPQTDTKDTSALEMNGNDKVYTNGSFVAADVLQPDEQIESNVQSAPDETDNIEPTQVSKVTLGSLATPKSDNTSDDDVIKDPDHHGNEPKDGDEPPPVSERQPTKQSRKSRDFHEYENVSLSTEDAEDKEEADSLDDSIEDDNKERKENGEEQKDESSEQ